MWTADACEDIRPGELADNSGPRARIARTRVSIRIDGRLVACSVEGGFYSSRRRGCLVDRGSGIPTARLEGAIATIPESPSPRSR